jgi:hypothetical protein
MIDIGAIVSTTADYVEGKINRRAEVEQGRRILGLREPGCNYRSDNKHSLYVSGGSIHPDNADALVTLSAPSILKAGSTGTLEIAEEVRGRIDSDLVLVGSPSSEGCGRLVLGYSEQHGDTDSLSFENPVLDLPYFWMLDKGSIDPKSQAGRFVPGKGLVRRDNWRIERRVGDKRLFVPGTDRDDYDLLLNDFLLVTRIRNYLSPGALDSGKMITIIGGAHGVGTKSISLLLNDREALAELANKVSEHQPYQAIFSVYDILHNATAGSRARGIKFLDAQVLPDDYLIWRSAHERIRPGLATWLRTMESHG